MSFSVILPYIKIGIFLAILSVVNWIYANLYFLPLLWLFTPGPSLNSDSNEQLDHFADEYSNKRLYLWSNPALNEDSTDAFESLSSCEPMESKVLASASIVRDHTLIYHHLNPLQLTKHLQPAYSSYLEAGNEEENEQLGEEEEEEEVEEGGELEEGEDDQPSTEEQDFYDQISSGQSSPANEDFQFYNQSNYENYPLEHHPPPPHETEV